MQSKKHFSYSKGRYYFTIKSIPNNITIYRKSKNEAMDSFKQYKALGKSVEWLGCWNGKKFEETSLPMAS